MVDWDKENPFQGYPWEELAKKDAIARCPGPHDDDAVKFERYRVCQAWAMLHRVYVRDNLIRVIAGQIDMLVWSKEDEHYIPVPRFEVQSGIYHLASKIDWRPNLKVVK